MCGRVSLATLPEELQRYVQRYRFPDVPPWYAPSYNIAPSQRQLVIATNSGVLEMRGLANVGVIN
jgi:putative SOS response-associated peptidase YedK